MSILVVFLVMITGAVGSAAMAGIIAYLLHRIKRLEDGTQDLTELTAALYTLQERLDANDRSMGQLEERVDFTERLLGDGPKDDA